MTIWNTRELHHNVNTFTYFDMIRKERGGKKVTFVVSFPFFFLTSKNKFSRKSCDVIYLQQQNESYLFSLIYFMLWKHSYYIVVFLVLQLKWSEDAVATLRGAVQLRAGVRPRYSPAFSQSNRRNSLQWCYRKWSCKLILNLDFFWNFSKIQIFQT